MRTMCSREIFTKKCRQQQIFDSDLKGAWHYNHVTFTPIAKNFMLYCRLIYMLSILCVRLTIKVKVGIPESFKVGWYPPKKTGSSHLKSEKFIVGTLFQSFHQGHSPNRSNSRSNYHLHGNFGEKFSPNGTGIFFGSESRNGIELYHLQNIGKFFAFSWLEAWPP